MKGIGGMMNVQIRMIVVTDMTLLNDMVSNDTSGRNVNLVSYLLMKH